MSVAIAPATAAPVTFQFEGYLTNAHPDHQAEYGFGVGSPFVASYTFNTTMTDIAPADPKIGAYRGGFTAVSLTIGGHLLLPPGPFLPADDHVIGISRDPSRDFSYDVVSNLQSRATNGTGLLQMSFQLTDPSQTAFDSDALPVHPPSLSSFANKEAVFYVATSTGGGQARGLITSLTAVPVPAAVLLFGTGLTALIGLGTGSWRRKQIRIV